MLVDPVNLTSFTAETGRVQRRDPSLRFDTVTHETGPSTITDAVVVSLTEEVRMPFQVQPALLEAESIESDSAVINSEALVQAFGLPEELTPSPTAAEYADRSGVDLTYLASGGKSLIQIPGLLIDMWV